MKFLPAHLSTMLATVWLVCVGATPRVQAQEAANPFALSERRVDLLRRLTRDYLAKTGAEVSDDQAARDILRRFSQGEPDCPTGMIAVEVRSDEAVEESVAHTVDGLVAKKFPPLEADKLETEAQARYPIYQKGDMVEFYYATNPQNVRKVRGMYGGRNARLVQVGAAAIQLEDIARVKGNDDLVIRFDPAASEELRKAYVAEKFAAYETAKEAYRAQATAYTRTKETERAWQENQAAGYLFVGQTWTMARDLVGSLIAEEKASLQKSLQEAMERKLADKRDRIAVAASQQAAQEPVVAAASRADVAAEYAAYQQRLAGVAARPEPEVVEGASPPEPVESQIPVSPESTGGTPVPPVEPSPVAPTQFLPLWAYAAILGVVVAGLIVVVVVVYRQRSVGPGQDLKKFFQGRGKVQRTFWQMAEEKPKTFKYVAYRYPTAEDARQALLQLSYVNERVGGDLVCRHDVYFGYGPHQDKFVSFVGGEKLNYALWREASAVFPEYPGAEYFRVSTAPGVNLEIPDLDTLLADPELQIQHVENREGEGTDYSQYYVYRAPAKDNALGFLKHAQVQEAGLHVIVLTKDGVFGKDENGIYEEAMDLWAERYPEILGEDA